MSRKASRALIVVAHGSGTAAWHSAFADLVADLEADVQVRSWSAVRPAFLGGRAPNIESVSAQLVADGFREIVVFPAFIAPGVHVTTDIPAMVDALRMRHPSVRYTVLPTVTELPSVRRAIGAAIKARVDDP